MAKSKEFFNHSNITQKRSSKITKVSKGLKNAKSDIINLKKDFLEIQPILCFHFASIVQNENIESKETLSFSLNSRNFHQT